MINSFIIKKRLDKEWNIFARSFNLCYVKKNLPVILGRFNNSNIQVSLMNFKKKSYLKTYTEIIVKHKNRNQQKIKILNKRKFSKLSLLHRIHENSGYSYYEHDFTGRHMLFSFTKLKNTLPKEIFKNLEDNINHELRINDKNLICSEPCIILSHNRLIDLCYFLTEFSKEISQDKFNQKQEVITR